MRVFFKDIHKCAKNSTGLLNVSIEILEIITLALHAEHLKQRSLNLTQRNVEKPTREGSSYPLRSEN